jgi:cytochrome b561
MTTGGTSRYNAWAMSLHWLIALAIVVQVCLGWWMNEVLPEHSPARGGVLQVHISLGVTIFILVLVRIGLRLAAPPPPLPAYLPAWERWAARASHLLFYLLMVVLPLTGWTLVSLRPRPIEVWGLPWPHMPLAGAIFGPNPSREAAEQLAHIHVFILIWILAINLALHVGAALTHQFDGKPVLWRMAPIFRPPSD